MGAQAVSLRTPLPWYGGKAIKCRRIAPHLPMRTCYVEPFGGMASVMLHRPPCAVELLNDRDGDVVNWWRTLRERPGELAHLVRFTALARDELAQALTDVDSDDPLIRAWAFSVIAIQGLGRSETPRQWRHTIGGVRTIYPNAVAADRIEAVAARMAHVQIENDDAIEVLERCIGRPGLVMYCDPPYRYADTRPYGAQVDHAVMVEALLAQPAESWIAVSGYPDDYPELTEAGWRTESWETVEHVNHQPRTETLWINQPDPQPAMF